MITRDNCRSFGSSAFHPTDEDLSVGTPDAADSLRMTAEYEGGRYAPAFAVAAFSACWLRLIFTILLRCARSFRNDLAS